MKLIGWCDAYTSPYETTDFTTDRKNAMIELVRRRHYSFNHFDHEYLGCCPFYDDGKICVLTKQQFDEVFDKAYAETPLGHRLTPQDAIKDTMVNDVLFENEKMKKEYLQKVGETNE